MKAKRGAASGSSESPARGAGTSGKSSAGLSTPSKNPTPSKARKKVELVSSKLAYHGPLFDVYKDYVQEPGEKVARRDVVRHSGSVVILAVDARESRRDPLIVVERQYRHAAGQYMWEIPAGRKETEEGTLAGAKRELLEETGYRAKRWTKLLRFYVSPGFLAEWMQVYLAEDLTGGDSRPDDDEYIEHRQIPLSQALEWIESGKIIDAKTIAAILMYERRRKIEK